MATCDRCKLEYSVLYETGDTVFGSGMEERKENLCENCLVRKMVYHHWDEVRDFVFKNIVETEKAMVTRGMNYIQENSFTFFSPKDIRFDRILNTEGDGDISIICMCCHSEINVDPETNGNFEILKHVLDHICPRWK